MKRISWLRDFLLLLCHLTYLPLPHKWYSDGSRLAEALRFLPLLGLFSGTIVYFSLRLFSVMPASGASAVLLGMHLLAGGAFLLRDLMFVADGIPVQPAVDELPAERPLLDEDVIEDNDTEIAAQQRRFRVSRGGLVWGFIWLLALYFSFYCLLTRPSLGQTAVLAAPVVGRFLMAWLVFYYPALPPARFHRAMTKKRMVAICAVTFIILLPFSRYALYVSGLFATLGVLLFATYRVHYLRALDEACYGAAAAWAEIIFLLAWLAFIRFF